jgi:hypothetical protein
VECERICKWAHSTEVKLVFRQSHSFTVNIARLRLVVACHAKAGRLETSRVHNGDEVNSLFAWHVVWVEHRSTIDEASN